MADQGDFSRFDSAWKNMRPGRRVDSGRRVEYDYRVAETGILPFSVQDVLAYNQFLNKLQSSVPPRFINILTVQGKHPDGRPFLATLEIGAGTVQVGLTDEASRDTTIPNTTLGVVEQVDGDITNEGRIHIRYRPLNGGPVEEFLLEHINGVSATDRNSQRPESPLILPSDLPYSALEEPLQLTVPEADNSAEVARIANYFELYQASDGSTQLRMRPDALKSLQDLQDPQDLLTLPALFAFAREKLGGERISLSFVTHSGTHYKITVNSDGSYFLRAATQKSDHPFYSPIRIEFSDRVGLLFRESFQHTVLATLNKDRTLTELRRGNKVWEIGFYDLSSKWIAEGDSVGDPVNGNLPRTSVISDFPKIIFKIEK